MALIVGAGKSLCYQLPTFILANIHKGSPGITLVVSPMISLMHDQMKSLPKGLSGACLSSAYSNVSLLSLSAKKIFFLFFLDFFNLCRVLNPCVCYLF